MNGLQEFRLQWNNYHNTIFTVLDDLFETQTFVDVILATEGQFIKACRIVLCAWSEFLKICCLEGELIGG